MFAVARAALVAAAVVAATADVHAAGSYDFLAAPEIDLNRIFRLDKATGEVGACQFGLKEGSPVGVTLCYPPAKARAPRARAIMRWSRRGMNRRAACGGSISGPA